MLDFKCNQVNAPGNNKEAVRFLYIAKGSVAELSCQLEIAHEIGFLAEPEHGRLQQECHELARMLGALIRVRSQHPKPAKGQKSKHTAEPHSTG